MPKSDKESLSEQIGFRLTKSLAEELSKRSVAAGAASQNDFARNVVLNFLSREESEEDTTDVIAAIASSEDRIESRFAELEKRIGELEVSLGKLIGNVSAELSEFEKQTVIRTDAITELLLLHREQHKKLRDDLATAVRVLLVKAGGLDKDAATEWVQKNLTSVK